MPTIIDSLVVTLGLDSKQFDAGHKAAIDKLRAIEEAADKHVKPARKNVGELEQAMAGLQGRLLAVASLFMGGMGLVAFTEHITKLTTQTGYLAKSLGVSVEELGKWRGVAASVGAGADEIAGSFQSIQDALSGIQSTGANALSAFSHMTQQQGQGPGVDLFRGGQKRAPTDILMDMSKWYEAQQDKAQASYILRQHAGMGQGMVSLLGLGPQELGKRLNQYQEFAPKPEQVAALTKLQEAFAQLQARAESLGRSFAALIAPELLTFMKSLEDIMKSLQDKGFVAGNKAVDKAIGNTPEGAAERRLNLDDRMKGWWYSTKRGFRDYIGRPQDPNDPVDASGNYVRPAQKRDPNDPYLGPLRKKDAIGGGGMEFGGRSRGDLNFDDRDLLKEGRDTNAILRDIRSLLGPSNVPQQVGGTGFPVGQGRRALLEGRRGGGSGVEPPGAAGGGSGGGGGGGGRAAREISRAVPDVGPMTETERNNLGLILKYESQGQNVMNYMGKRQGIDPSQAKGYTAQGYYQMLNTNWRRLAPGLGIKETNAMSASYEDQTKVALALMRERPGAGIGHWANFNPALRAALQRGETVASTPAGPNAPPSGPSVPSVANDNRGLVNTINNYQQLGIGAAGAVNRGGDSNVSNSSTSSMHIGEMNVSIPRGADPAAYASGITQELDHFVNVQNSNTGLR